MPTITTVRRQNGRYAVYEVDTPDIDLAHAIAESVVDSISSYTGHKTQPDAPPIRYTWIYSTTQAPAPPKKENPFL